MSAWEDVAPSLTRVQDRYGNTVGTGLLVARRHVLTCAHVVLKALKVADPRSQERPEGTVGVKFAHFPEAPPIEAHVEPGDWKPIDGAGGGDIALLKLASDPPRGARVETLVDCDVPRETVLDAIGFPAGNDPGVWAVTKASMLIPGAGWLQLQRAGSVTIQPGFSGGPVVSARHGGVVGVVVARWLNGQPDGPSFMLPTRVIFERFVRLKPPDGKLPRLVDLVQVVALVAQLIVLMAQVRR